MAEFTCPHCQAATVDAGADRCPGCGQPPVVCGHFRIDELLGKGGMGLVYAARDERDGRAVAVKLLSLKGGADWKIYELFERSTTVLRGLEHRALPRIDAFEKTAAGGLVLVRERFDGGNLEERVLGRQRTPGQAELRGLLRSLLELLAYLHGRNPPVLHRDIKASNIMFRSAADREPVLVDFDTIAAPGSQTHRTTLVVSPGYTAPEQYAGDVSPASDLYSLGATMLLAATGTHPDELPRRDGRFVVEDRLGGLEPALRKVVLKLVEPDKRARYARAEEALADLQGRAQAPVPPPKKRERKKERKQEPPASSGVGAAKEHAGRTAVSHRGLWLALCSLVILVAGALGFVFQGELAFTLSATIAGLGGLPLTMLALQPHLKKDDDGKLALIATAVCSVLLFGLIAGQTYYWEYRDGQAAEERKRSGEGVLDAAVMIPGSGPGARLLVVDHIEVEDTDWYRLNLHDAITGRRLGRRILGTDRIECAPTVPGPMWCSMSSDPPMLVDGSTLETIADYAELRRRTPGLAEKPDPPVYVDRARGDAFQLMPDGRTWRFDARTLLAAPLSDEAAAEFDAGQAAGTVKRLGETPNVRESSVFRDGETYWFQAVAGGRRQRFAIGERAVSTDDFLDPYFVVNAGTGGPLTVPGSSAFLVEHATSLDYEAARLQLSAVSAEARTLWTVTLDDREVLLAMVVGDAIVIASMVSGQQGHVQAFAAADGSTRWTLDK